MARVNLLPVELLTDQHLMAEKREINVIAGCLRKSFYSKSGIVYSEIPDQYNLNEHHIKFFYNKRSYLKKRFKEIWVELEKRGYKLNTPFLDTWSELGLNTPKYNKKFVPTKRDYEIITQRIIERVEKRKDWYTLHGAMVTTEIYTWVLRNFVQQQ